MLTSIANGLTVCFDQNAGCFKAQSDPAGESPWLSLVKYSSIRDDDEMTYTATKVSVSAVPDGHRVILYTRVWDEANKTYLFYAVDHEGKLEPCFECGNNIMWVDDRANTLLWDFTEYKNSAGTAPSYYYELHNRYSGKYLAPQLHNNQIVADSKIGINMPGRKENEYHTEILAWDAQSYAYTGLRVDPQTKTLVPCVRSKADTFYFATVDSLEHQLTKVDTIDNEKFGVTMKMIDYKSVPVGTNSGLSYNQGLVLDNNETGSNGSKTFTIMLKSTEQTRRVPNWQVREAAAAAGIPTTTPICPASSAPNGQASRIVPRSCLRTIWTRNISRRFSSPRNSTRFHWLTTKKSPYPITTITRHSASGFTFPTAPMCVIPMRTATP